MHIRIVREGDCVELVLLMEQLGYETSEEQLRSRMERFAGNALDKALVAEDGGRIVGLIVLNVLRPFHVEGFWGRVSALVVDEPMRGNGLGADLLRAGCKYLEDVGCTKIELTSSEHRVNAHKFYVKNGFEEKPKRFVKAFEI